MDNTAPATKADISILMQRMGDMDNNIHALKIQVDQKADETKRHFDVVAEDLKHDFWGIHNDKISVLNDRSNNHEERIVTIEKQLAI